MQQTQDDKVKQLGQIWLAVKGPFASFTDLKTADISLC